MSVIEERPRRSWKPLGQDALAILGSFLLLGIIGGLLWWQLTPLSEWVRTGETATLDESGMGNLVAVDGWFFVVAAAGGVLGGAVLSAWRVRDPIATVLLITVGACLASAVMHLVGHQLGPGSVDVAIQRAGEGDRVPAQLTPEARGVYLTWPVAALLATLAVLWGTRERVPSSKV